MKLSITILPISLALRKLPSLVREETKGKFERIVEKGTERFV